MMLPGGRCPLDSPQGSRAVPQIPLHLGAGLPPGEPGGRPYTLYTLYTVYAVYLVYTVYTV